MPFHPHKDLKYILHPYIFVLKENKGIQKDLFDYSLWMMRMGSLETIRAPKNRKGNLEALVDEFEMIRANLNSSSTQ